MNNKNLMARTAEQLGVSQEMLLVQLKQLSHVLTCSCKSFAQNEDTFQSILCAALLSGFAIGADRYTRLDPNLLVNVTTLLTRLEELAALKTLRSVFQQDQEAGKKEASH